jgi:hypothetical protein
MNLAIAIGRINDTKELCRLKAAITRRIKLLEHRAWEARCQAAWDHVKNIPAGGAPLFCCAEGMFFGSWLQRGDRVEVYAVRPRKRLLWVRASNGKLYSFSPANIARYNLRTTPPANPLSATERALSDGVANILTRAIGIPPS